MAEETEKTETAPAAETAPVATAAPPATTAAGSVVLATAEAADTKNKKINKMSLGEVDAAIKKTQEHMAGMTSTYAVALLARKKDLEAAAAS